MDASPIRVIALSSCILGVFFLAKSISVKSPKYMLHELLSFKVNKSRFFRRFVGQKLEAFIGFLFLFVGFALQIYLEVQGLAEIRHQAGQGASGFANWWLVIGVTVGAMLLIALLLNRVTRYFSGKIFVENVRFMVEQHKYPLESDESLVLEMGRIMRVPRTEEDTVESYSKRVREKMKVTREATPPQADRRFAY